ncbi:iron ABC transporter permease [Paenactinomyces guangxiensis]|uniref:Iron ABC transporter permease n=2 Tax=Paenactinomyces guangxiensis TaxID=1490290 RepID=A0A7W2A7L6_9BACL|nr:iron ABC transporter permease [Paenactinomyces guangxiensis]MBA4493700.1 iron ABC transporter permease [Paenactinomyces guangxiensis]MBH8590987.1 iron ABC transporter permease [Paenactinomyces guangxiensis]
MILVLLLMGVSISVGVTNIPLTKVIKSFTQFNGSNEHLIIQTTRVPRAIISVVVGAGLAVAGAVMQALTRNPLASPATLGVNAGASLFIVIAVSFFSITSLTSLMSIGFVGAAVASFTVYFLGSVGKEGLTPVKLTLAGAAIAALFSSLTHGLLVMNEKGLDELLFWLTGSVEGRKLEMVSPVFPFVIGGWVLAFLLAKPINVLATGEDVAKGLGQRTGWTKLAGAAVIILLAGGSVAIAGPIVFVGLVVPHLARTLVGIDHRWLIPYCAVLGALLLLGADIGGRFIMVDQEIPVGVMTAIIGTPFFIYIARRKVTEQA